MTYCKQIEKQPFLTSTHLRQDSRLESSTRNPSILEISIPRVQREQKVLQASHSHSAARVCFPTLAAPHRRERGAVSISTQGKGCEESDQSSSQHLRISLSRSSPHLFSLILLFRKGKKRGGKWGNTTCPRISLAHSKTSGGEHKRCGTALSPLCPPLRRLPRAPGTRCSQCQPPPPRPFCPAAGPAARSSPLLSGNTPSPAAFSSSSQGTEAAARQGAGAASYCKAPSNNWERQRRVRAHLPEIRLLGRNLDFIPPPPLPPRSADCSFPRSALLRFEPR